MSEQLLCGVVHFTDGESRALISFPLEIVEEFAGFGHGITLGAGRAGLLGVTLLRCYASLSGEPEMAAHVAEIARLVALAMNDDGVTVFPGEGAR